jgi:hypothetical protein
VTPWSTRWRTLGGPLAPPRRQRTWLVAGALLELVASAAIVVCAARYGNRASLPHGVVAVVVAAAVVELVGAVLLARALAPSRGAFALLVPVLFVWPLLVVVLAAAFLLTLGGGAPWFFGGGSGRRHETARGRRRRQRLAKRSR